jgi:4-amino-4-deoxy-L-arabinose transferase-like glycosyltransferase
VAGERPTHGAGGPARVPRTFALPLACIVAAGVVLRVLYTVLVAPWPPGIPDDQVYFNLMPGLLADGEGFAQPLLAARGEFRPTAAHPPLYPLVLAGPAELGLDGQLLQRLTGTLFGAGTIVVIALIARRLAGASAGLIAAGLAAVYPILVTADGALMSESLYGLLVGLSLLAAYRLVDRGRLADRGGLGLAALLGALVGLAALTRGEALLLLPLVLVPVVRRPGGLRAGAVACVAMVVVLTPWTVRNLVVFDRPVLISTNAGAVVAGANCAGTYYGSNIGGWDLSCTLPYPEENEAGETAKQLRDGFDYASDHLTRLPVVAAARLARGWSLFQPWQANAGRSSVVQGIGVVMFWLLLPLAVYGLVTLRRRSAPTWLIVVPIVMVSITMVTSYGYLRFRQPAEISLVVLAAVALEALRGRVHTRRDPAPA